MRGALAGSMVRAHQAPASPWAAEAVGGEALWRLTDFRRRRWLGRNPLKLRKKLLALETGRLGSGKIAHFGFQITEHF